MSDINPTIYVVHHAPLPIELDHYLSPIRVSHYHDVPNHVLTDHTGDNIASKNREYAELTALYWMWKNDAASTHLGLWHYRRWMIPNPAHYKMGPEQTNIWDYKYTNVSEIEKFKITPETLIQACTDYDVILPYWQSFGKTIETQFADAVSQPLLDIVYKAFDALYPTRPSLRDFLRSNSKSIYCNMAILRRDVFMDYCDFLFPLLAEAEKDPYLDIHLKGLNPDQTHRSHGLDPRWAGFWGERLLAYYAKHVWLQDPSLKITNWRMFVFNKG